MVNPLYFCVLINLLTTYIIYFSPEKFITKIRKNIHAKSLKK